ncbi:DUF6527 family protein [Sneathiella sp.]|uniref:DUF6527 family protein n=1 Tax=Sneathiella sp. TaxID=1964365 RepID=UPI002FE2F11B
MDYATVAHKCCCGCGLEVVTPLSPTDWKLTYDGVAVSLHPSVGNWSFPCRSHYWIDKGTVRWAGDWTQEQVNAGRAHDRRTKDRFFSEKTVSAAGQPSGAPPTTEGMGWWSRFKKWLSGD